MFADRLKKSLLQAAIQGQLTEQLPTDGDARDLLRKIRAEKTKLIAEKKLRLKNPCRLSPMTKFLSTFRRAGAGFGSVTCVK